jgi:hypothetical protein
MVESGRRLDVSVVPLPLFVTWSFMASGDRISAMWAASRQRPVRDARHIACDFVDGSGRWTAWLSEPGAQHQGGSAGPALLTVSGVRAKMFRPGRGFDFYSRSEQDGESRHPGGTLVAPAAEPEWLRRLLTPDPAAFQPWESRISRVQVAEDGSHLWLHVSTDRGEVPAAVDLRESDDRVEARVRVGIDPAHPPRLPRGRPSSRPGRSRVHYAGVEVVWRLRVPLASPLGDRPVHDLGSEDSAARWAARLAWHEIR